MFKKEFLLFDFLSSSMTNGTWYIDSGTSCHMTEVREIFIILAEMNMHLDIEIGDNSMYGATRLGTIYLKRGLDDLLEVKDVLYVPGMKKNLLSISKVEDNGLAITFIRG